MKTIKINPKNIKDEELDLITDYLLKGKVIAYPTDTIYGLGCVATSEKAIRKILKIKKIKKQKPFLILVESFDMLKKYCYVSAKQRKYLNSVWPGPVTVILKSRGLIPSILSGEQGSIGVRLPKNDFLIKMIKRVNLPIVSTSLNVSGKPVLDDISKIKSYFSILPDLVINYTKIKQKKPSKLIDIRDIKNIKILRK